MQRAQGPNKDRLPKESKQSSMVGHLLQNMCTCLHSTIYIYFQQTFTFKFNPGIVHSTVIFSQLQSRHCPVKCNIQSTSTQTIFIQRSFNSSAQSAALFKEIIDSTSIQTIFIEQKISLNFNFNFFMFFFIQRIFELQLFEVPGRREVSIQQNLPLLTPPQQPLSQSHPLSERRAWSGDNLAVRAKEQHGSRRCSMTRTFSNGSRMCA